MKDKISPVKNVLRLAELGESLKDRNFRTPGVGLVTGRTGFGKTTALTWYGVRRERAAFVRAYEVWTPMAMLKTIATELGVEPKSSLIDMLHAIVREMVQQSRMLIVDEADYVIDKRALVNTLRDIHDTSAMPLILVGMDDLKRKLRSRIDQRQFAGRIAFELEFQPLDFADTKLLAEDLFDFAFEPELLQKIHASCAGEARLATVAMQRVESLAIKKNLKRVGLREWGDRPLHVHDTANPAPRPA